MTATTALDVGQRVILQRQHFQSLLDALSGAGYDVIGPTLRDNAIVYDEVDTVEELPIGWTDEQDGGSYRLRRRSDAALFGYTVGPHAWKQFLHPPQRRLWTATRNGDGESLEIAPELPDVPRRAFFGVRSCELHAIDIQSKVFTGGPYIDPLYKTLRDNTLIIAVNCTQAGGTCFCVSMQTGPRASSGFDLALTEILDAHRHIFLIEVGSERGADLLEAVPFEEAYQNDEATVRQLMDETARTMGRTMNTFNIKNFLYANSEHPRWQDVAERCLTCGNCTNVCPTCFCTTVEDVTSLTGDSAERWQRWDSCFTSDFSYIHGGSVRASSKSRYRQWLTHKLAAWIDQFDTSGCVGCGRCITWCPVGIDLTEEIHAMRDSDSAAMGADLTTLNAV